MNVKLLAFFFIFALLTLFVAKGFFVNYASAQSLEAITIKPDGSISPSTASVVKTGNVYRMTANISGSVTIQRSNVVFDGQGFMIQSPGWSWALRTQPPTPIEPALNNVTIKNVKVAEDPNTSGWSWGIVLDTTTNSLVANCTVSDIRDGNGIWIMDRCTGNLIVGNNFTNVHLVAIYVWERNTTIVGNRITACGTAVYFASTSNNTVFGNHIEGNSVGIECFSQNPLPPGLKNLIYCNNFIRNNLTFLNEAVFIGDTGVLAVPAIVNVWDNGTLGNYWSDYNGADANGDGIGETACFIDDNYPLEGGNDTDHYPLMNPVNITSFASYSLSSLSPSPTIPEITPPALLVMLTAIVSLATFALRRKNTKNFEPTFCKTRIFKRSCQT